MTNAGLLLMQQSIGQIRRPWSSILLNHLPYFIDAKRKLKLPPSHPALLLFANFQGQCMEKLVDTNIINAVQISLNCTKRLQPLNLVLTRLLKSFGTSALKMVFPSGLFLARRKNFKGTRLTVMKPLSAKWLVKFQR